MYFFFRNSCFQEMAFADASAPSFTLLGTPSAKRSAKMNSCVHNGREQGPGSCPPRGETPFAGLSLPSIPAVRIIAIKYF